MTEEDMFENMEVTDSSAPVQNEVKLETPAITSPEWNDFVMELFTEDELFEGRPVVAGLRRVAELLLGEIVFSGPTQVFPANTETTAGRSTIVYTVRFSNGQEFSDVADSWAANTNDEFLAFNTSTASTRAAGRALRAALRLKTVAAEELTTKDTAELIQKMDSENKTFTSQYDTAGDMTSSQRQFLVGLCQRADIDPKKLITHILNKDPSRVTKEEASELIEKVNEFQQGTGAPEEVRGFRSGEF